jgi:hypothetical protein
MELANVEIATLVSHYLSIHSTFIVVSMNVALVPFFAGNWPVSLAAILH